MNTVLKLPFVFHVSLKKSVSTVEVVFFAVESIIRVTYF